MKLYKRSDFILLPKNTIYSKLDRESINGLYCKVSSHEDLANDFYEQNLIGEYGVANSLNLRDTFQEFRTDLNCSSRDGMYDDKDVFVVWDRLDIQKLHAYLGNALARPEQIDVDFLIEKHPELTREQAFDLMKFAAERTIRLKSCYGDGQIMYPKWLESKGK